MAKQTTIEEAIKSALETLTEANGYSWTIERVVRGDFSALYEDVPFAMVSKVGPIARSRPGDADDNVHIHEKRGRAQFAILLWDRCPSGDPTEDTTLRDAMESRADDIEIVIETPIDGECLGLGFVDDAWVSSTELLMGANIPAGWWLQSVVVDVEYLYDRLQP